jgi:hypothetical protein
MASKKFRQLKPHEAALIRSLLSATFSGRDELRTQIEDAKVREVDEDGSLEFRVGGGPKAPVVRRIPVEAEADDADGGNVHVLLHVVQGRIDELEFYKEDGSRVLTKPQPEELRVMVLGQ